MTSYLAPFQSQPAELSIDSPRVEGAIPSGLRGTLLRNGPGVFASGETPLHFLDGHALAVGLCFDGAAPRLRSRVVRTGEYVAEQAAGRMLYRRLFTNLPSRWANLFKLPKGDNANHDIYVHGGRIVASNDLGHYALDGGTLSTAGRARYGDLQGKDHLISPMPRVDPSSGRLVGYVIKPGGPRPDKITFFEADDDGRVVSSAAAHTLATSPAIVHDVAFTPSWYVATQGAARLSVGGALWGRRTVLDCVDWNAGGAAELILVSRPAGERSMRLPIPGGVLACFHVLNAWEEGDRVVVDLIAYEGTPDFGLFGPEILAAARPGQGITPAPRLVRLTVHPGTGAVERRAIADVAGDLPEVRPDRFGRPYNHVWLAAPAAGSQAPDPNAFPWFGDIVGVNTHTGAVQRWSSGSPTSFVSQPAFAPRGEEEDDGWLLVWVEDGAKRTASVVILDARDLAAGPVARVELGEHLPGASHVTWAPGHVLAA